MSVISPLYHGSKFGIRGQIRPVSRNSCDFGPGFYMGTNELQAKSLVYEKEVPTVYQLSLSIDNIPANKILRTSEQAWAWIVLFNRGHLQSITNTPLYQSIKNTMAQTDIIIGPIADDKMYQVMQQFIDGDITDTVMFKCLNCMNYGQQYVAKTQFACDQIRIISEKAVSVKDIQQIETFRSMMRNDCDSKVDAIKKQFRRQGNFFDEILEKVITVDSQDRPPVLTDFPQILYGHN